MIVYQEKMGEYKSVIMQNVRKRWRYDTVSFCANWLKSFPFAILNMNNIETFRRTKRLSIDKKTWAITTILYLYKSKFL